MRINKLIRILVVISVLAFIAVGCSHQPLPGVRIEPVTTFSLGNAKFAPFKTRPTAEQLRNTALRLYDSFDTAAATAKMQSEDVSKYVVVEGRAEDIQMSKSEVTRDFRAAKPDKEMTTGAITEVRNGEKRYAYDPKRGHYFSLPLKQDGHRMPVGNWAGLYHARPFSMRLLPDQQVNGAEVFVLEFRMPAERSTDGEMQPAMRSSVFLGKNDLLPRREETSIERAGGPVAGLPDDIIRFDFLGFVANSKLSEDLFPAQPLK